MEYSKQVCAVTIQEAGVGLRLRSGRDVRSHVLRGLALGILLVSPAITGHARGAWAAETKVVVDSRNTGAAAYLSRAGRVIAERGGGLPRARHLQRHDDQRRCAAGDGDLRYR